MDGRRAIVLRLRRTSGCRPTDRRFSGEIPEKIFWNFEHNIRINDQSEVLIMGLINSAPGRAHGGEGERGDALRLDLLQGIE
jgi:hypothetical protein